MQGFRSTFARRSHQLRAELVACGLTPDDQTVTRFWLLGFLRLCLPLALGTAKVITGLSRDRPVGILTALLIATAIAGLIGLGRQPHRSRTGSKAIEAARQANTRAARAPIPDEFALAYALSGAAILSGQEWRWVIKPHGASSSSGSSGCGSSGGDGGGGGGCS